MLELEYNRIELYVENVIFVEDYGGFEGISFFNIRAFLIASIFHYSFFINFKDSMGVATMDGLIFNFSITRITCMKFNTVE